MEWVAKVVTYDPQTLGVDIMETLSRWRTHASVAMIVIFVLGTGGFLCPSSGPGPVTATSGSISVNPGYGPQTSNSYQCTGPGGTITITAQNLTGTGGQAQSPPQTFSWPASSSTTESPGCQAFLTFLDLRPGSWRVSDGVVTCATTVIAGQPATVKIYHHVCS